MPWYQCSNEECKSAMDVQTIRRVVRPATQDTFCIDCGQPTSPVMDMDETWWLTMERSHQLSRGLLKDLMKEWQGQTVEPRFDLWLENYLSVAMAEESA